MSADLQTQAQTRFQEQGYTLLRHKIPEAVCVFGATYLRMIQANGEMGWDDKQVKNGYSAYAPRFSEALMLECQPFIEEAIGEKVYPSYSYARIYTRGAILERHVDRPACEVSCTVPLAFDPAHNWPLYIQPKNTQTPLEVYLNLGDMAVYEGLHVPHWREAFEGEWHIQTFLHYVRQNGPYADKRYDGRPRCGAPPVH